MLSIAKGNEIPLSVSDGKPEHCERYCGPCYAAGQKVLVNFTSPRVWSAKAGSGDYKENKKGRTQLLTVFWKSEQAIAELSTTRVCKPAIHGTTVGFLLLVKLIKNFM